MEGIGKTIRAYYPDVPKGAGRRPIGLERYVANPFSTALVRAVDPEAKKLFMTPRAMRLFVGIDLGKEPVLDERYHLQISPLDGKITI